MKTLQLLPNGIGIHVIVHIFLLLQKNINCSLSM